MAAEGERLVADAQATPCGALRNGREVLRSSAKIVDRCGLHVAAYENKVGPERLHDVEFALGPVQIARALWLRHALEVAQRVVERDGEAEPVTDAFDIGRGA